MKGWYLCEVSNGIGKALEASAKLIVQSLPQIKPQSKQVILKKLDHAQVACIASGSAPLNIMWLKNGYLFTRRDNYIVRDEMRGDERVSYVTINQGTRTDSGVFKCIATNLHGSDSVDINV